MSFRPCFPTLHKTRSVHPCTSCRDPVTSELDHLRLALSPCEGTINELTYHTAYATWLYNIWWHAYACRVITSLAESLYSPILIYERTHVTRCCASTLRHKNYRMRFNFRGVYISRICNFRGFRVFKFAGAGYSGVEIFAGEIFADVFRHVVLVPVGVPMLAQEVFPQVYHPLFFLSGQFSAIRLLPPSHCALLQL